MFIINKRGGFVIVVLSVLLLVLLFFMKIDMDEKADELCGYVHATSADGTQVCVAHSGIGSWVIIVVAGVAFLFLFIGLYIILLPYMKKEEKKD
ncbi:hypothetical protein HZA99_05105, partial [Candidatus Woesearchaeota archaeon]|nr:hypothetical protein [Candidatus Woesearchaeota archaeon]